jgi:hypothetical protein
MREKQEREREFWKNFNPQNELLSKGMRESAYIANKECEIMFPKLTSCCTTFFTTI